MIQSELVNKLKCGHEIDDRKVVNIQNASGDTMSTTGTIQLEIEVGNKWLTHKFIVTNEKNLPSKMILGWDFMKKHQIKLQTNPLLLSIGGNKVTIVELSKQEVMRITNLDEIKTPQPAKEEVAKENTERKCHIQETMLIKGSTIGYLTLETKVVENEVAMFEPIPGNIGADILCPGLVSLESDNSGKKARFTIKYINFKNEDLVIEAGKTVGYIQACNHQEIEEIQYNEVAAITETTGKDRLQEMFLEVDQMVEVGSRENKILKHLINKYPQVFSSGNEPPSITPFYYHTIHLQSTPKPKKPYIIPVCFHEKVKSQIQDMVKTGIIRPSRSPFHSPLVPVVKKDGTIRLCVDFRNLNTHIISDSYPLPNISQILHNLGKGKIFSCLDLKQGYHQIPLTEESKPYTAFIAPGGLYEYNVMPMGLKDSPSAFSRIINQVLVGLTGNNTHVYMDDIIVHGENFEDHINNLEKVLMRLQEAKLSLKLSKCEFFQNSVKYLGHIISSEGLEPQPDKVNVIKSMNKPQTLKQLQSFLGMVTYYRKFIYKFADIAAPLNKLTGGKLDEKKPKRRINWNKEAEEAFVELKNALINKVTLSFPDFSKPFFLTTDASNVAIGGVLQQKDSCGRLRPLTFFSRKLNKSEVNYSTIEREALSIVYGLKINRPLILGYPVIIQTDHRPLTWLLTTSSANSRIARWQLLVAEFEIEVKYLPGRENKVADCLSRLKQEEDSFSDETVAVITRDTEKNREIEWNLTDLIKKQDEDSIYGKIKQWFKEGYSVHKIKEEINKFKGEKKKYKKIKPEEMHLDNDVLYRVTNNSYGELTRQIVVPESYTNQAMHLAHSLPTAGHGGVQITLARCRKYAYWPGMKADIQEFCKSCLVCRRFKRLGDAPAPLRRYPDVEMPFERVHMDLIGPMGHSQNGYKYCMVVIDTLTRYLIASPLKSKEATEVAKAFFESVVCVQGVPKTLVTDQGKEFINSILKEVATFLKMEHIKTTPYHPQANGVIERCNGTVVNILRTLIEDNISIWDSMLQIAVFAYNSGYNRTVKDSPFYLMFLRDPSFPFEVMKEENKWYNIDDFKQEMATKANRVYGRCQIYLDQGKEESERRRSKNAKIKPIKVGDRVYVRQPPMKGTPSKLQPAYTGPFRVTSKVSDVVVRLRNIKTGAIKTLHTDRVRVIHEDNVAPNQNKNVRKAYPVHDDEMTEQSTPSEQLDPFPFYSSNNEDTGRQPENTQNIQETNRPNGQGRYQLRSTTKPSELPLVMDKPLEYIKKPKN